MPLGVLDAHACSANAIFFVAVDAVLVPDLDGVLGEEEDSVPYVFIVDVARGARPAPEEWVFTVAFVDWLEVVPRPPSPEEASLCVGRDAHHTGENPRPLALRLEVSPTFDENAIEILWTLWAMLFAGKPAGIILEDALHPANVKPRGKSALPNSSSSGVRLITGFPCNLRGVVVEP